MIPDGLLKTLVTKDTKIQTRGAHGRHFTQVLHDLQSATPRRAFHCHSKTPNTPLWLGLGQLPQVPHNGNVSVSGSVYHGRVADTSQTHASLQRQLAQILHNANVAVTGGVQNCLVVEIGRIHASLQRQLTQVLHNVTMAVPGR
jgi:hypothetical protein